MKRTVIFSLFCLILIFSLSSCRQEENYSPSFTLAQGYTLKGDRITATLIGEESLTVRDFLLCSDAVTVYSDSTGSHYVQGLDAEIPLKPGENHLILSISNGTQKKEYNLDITCISIESFSISVKNPNKTYHIGEAFDKSTITVTAVAEDGTEFEVIHYTPEYEFSALGESIVGIELDGYYESFTVLVTEEYRPVLDSDGIADGVLYLIRNGEAILVRAEDKEGFFAVPSVVLKDGMEYPVTEIESFAFASSWITSIMISDSVRMIGDQAFADCMALEWVEMPESMDSLGAFAFYRCESLLSIAVSNGITVLRNSVFRDCKALSDVYLPSSLEEIEKQAFAGCESLSDLQFPHGLRVIGDAAFRSCKSFSTIVVEKLQTLGSEAFADCEALHFVAVGTVEEMGSGIFSGVKHATVYGQDGSAFLKQAKEAGLKTQMVSEGEYCIASLPVEFPIEGSYPYDETKIFFLSEGKMKMLSDYTVEYPRDACGYLRATIKKDSFSHTFVLFISYTEDVALDMDSRGVQYSLDPVTGKAVLVKAPEWIRQGSVYQPETEGLFLVPTTLWHDGKMYVVVYVEEDAFDETKNAETIFKPILKKESL